MRRCRIYRYRNNPFRSRSRVKVINRNLLDIIICDWIYIINHLFLSFLGFYSTDSSLSFCSSPSSARLELRGYGMRRFSACMMCIKRILVMNQSDSYWLPLLVTWSSQKKRYLYIYLIIDTWLRNLVAYPSTSLAWHNWNGSEHDIQVGCISVRLHGTHKTYTTGSWHTTQPWWRYWDPLKNYPNLCWPYWTTIDTSRVHKSHGPLCYLYA